MPARKAAARASLPGGFEVSIRRYCWSHPAASESAGSPARSADGERSRRAAKRAGSRRLESIIGKLSGERQEEKKQKEGLRVRPSWERELESLWSGDA